MVIRDEFVSGRFVAILIDYCAARDVAIIATEIPFEFPGVAFYG